MCQSVIINGEWCFTVGDLRKHVKTIVVDDPEDYEITDDCCLCPVDLLETAIENGYRSRGHEHDSMAVRFIPRRIK